MVDILILAYLQIYHKIILDYHKNLNDYLKAKLYLFEKLIKKNGNVIADKEIPQFKKIKKITLNKNLNLIH